MQVKKFEAPTIQEALETVKRELGPEAVILQTKKYRRGFGLMSKSSVEVTAAVSERSIQKKQYTESSMPMGVKSRYEKMPAERQTSVQEDFLKKHVEATRDRVELGKGAPSGQAGAQGGGRKITATRYIDIDSEAPAQPQGQAAAKAKAAPAPAQPKKGQVTDPALLEEVRRLKRMLEEVKFAQENLAPAGPGGAQALIGTSPMANPTLQDVYEQLVVGGIDKRHAYTLVKKAAFELGGERARNPEAAVDQVASEIMETVKTFSPLDGITPGAAQPGAGPVVMALVGPTGVGKTTTVAKIASEAMLRRGLKVGLINLDNYKVAAFDQLGTYAKILNVPFRNASSADDLNAALRDFQGIDLVLIDTTGRSQKDPQTLAEMQAVLGGAGNAGNMRTELVLSATTRDTELYDMAQRFQVFKPEGLIISKLDEASLFGAIYNVHRKSKLPLSYFTTGQRVPEDLEEASRERVAALILDL